MRNNATRERGAAEVSRKSTTYDGPTKTYFSFSFEVGHVELGRSFARGVVRRSSIVVARAQTPIFGRYDERESKGRAFWMFVVCTVCFPRAAVRDASVVAIDCRCGRVRLEDGRLTSRARGDAGTH